MGYIGGVAFIENVATKGGGAIYLGGNILMQAGHATYRSNTAEFGGAIYVALAVDKLTEFSTCLFEGNQATDGGAVYLYTGTGLDIFTDCVFRDNFASECPDRPECIDTRLSSIAPEQSIRWSNPNQQQQQSVSSTEWFPPP